MSKFEIPRKTYPHGQHRIFEEAMRREGVDEEQAKSLAAAYERVSEQFALDEEENYRAIEDGMNGYVLKAGDSMSGTLDFTPVPDETAAIEFAGGFAVTAIEDGLVFAGPTLAVGGPPGTHLMVAGGDTLLLGVAASPGALLFDSRDGVLLAGALHFAIDHLGPFFRLGLTIPGADPNGEIAANIGSVVGMANGDLWTKVADEGLDTGWKRLLTEDDLP